MSNAQKLSKKRRSPTKIEELFGGKAAIEFISHYCRIYFESLDCIINAIEDWFGQEDFRTYVKLENLLLKAAKDDVFIQEYTDIMAIYSISFGENRFQVQFKYVWSFSGH